MKKDLDCTRNPTLLCMQKLMGAGHFCLPGAIISSGNLGPFAVVIICNFFSFVGQSDTHVLSMMENNSFGKL